VFSTALLRLRTDGNGLIVLLFEQHSPSDPRQFIGDGDDDFIACGALLQLMDPVSESAGVVLHCLTQGVTPEGVK